MRAAGGSGYTDGFTHGGSGYHARYSRMASLAASATAISPPLPFVTWAVIASPCGPCVVASVTLCSGATFCGWWGSWLHVRATRHFEFAAFGLRHLPMVVSTWKASKPNPVYLVPPLRQSDFVAAVGLRVGEKSGTGLFVRHRATPFTLHEYPRCNTG